MTRIKEKEEREMNKKRFNNLPIHRKSTATTRAPLQKYKDDFDMEVANEYGDGNASSRAIFSKQQKLTINTALAISKNRDTYKKKMRPQSSMAEYIGQKKDIFRVELVNTSI